MSGSRRWIEVMAPSTPPPPPVVVPDGEGSIEDAFPPLSACGCGCGWDDDGDADDEEGVAATAPVDALPALPLWSSTEYSAGASSSSMVGLFKRLPTESVGWRRRVLVWTRLGEIRRVYRPSYDRGMRSPMYRRCRVAWMDSLSVCSFWYRYTVVLG